LRRDQSLRTDASAGLEDDMYEAVMTGLLLFPWILLGVSVVGALAHRRR